MISLDEEMVGQDAGTLIIRAIKVCAGVACQLADGRVVGAHFSSTCPSPAIVTALNFIHNQMVGGSSITSMSIVLNASEWGGRISIVPAFKGLLRFDGTAKVYDKNILGASVDIRLQSGQALECQTTDAGDGGVLQATNAVHKVMLGMGDKFKTNPLVAVDNRRYFHKVPANVTGFAPMQIGFAAI